MIDELLLMGADDWVMAADVASLATSAAGAVTDEEICRIAISTIAAVVMKGLMQVGDVTDGGFFEWDLPPEAAVEKVTQDWIALGHSPDLGEICWLANTLEGDRYAAVIRSTRESDR